MYSEGSAYGLSPATMIDFELAYEEMMPTPIRNLKVYESLPELES